VLPALVERLVPFLYSLVDQITSKPKPPDAPNNLFAPVSGRHATRGDFNSQARASVSSFSATSVRGTLALAALAIVVFAALAGAVLFQLFLR
jgi:hypothetical protein